MTVQVSTQLTRIISPALILEKVLCHVCVTTKFSSLKLYGCKNLGVMFMNTVVKYSMRVFSGCVLVPLCMRVHVLLSACVCVLFIIWCTLVRWLSAPRWQCIFVLASWTVSKKNGLHIKIRRKIPRIRLNTWHYQILIPQSLFFLF